MLNFTVTFMSDTSLFVLANEKKNKAFCHLYFVIKKFEVKVDAFDVVIVAIYVCVLIIKYNLILWWSVIKCLLQQFLEFSSAYSLSTLQ